MKKIILLAVAAGLQCMGMIAQNFNTAIGVFTFTNNPSDTYHYASELYLSRKHYNWLGYGINLGPSWEFPAQGPSHILLEVKFQYMEGFSETQEWSMNLGYKQVSNIRLQYFGAVGALGAARDFQAFHRKWQAYGGLYTRIALRDWYKAAITNTNYQPGQEGTYHHVDWHTNNLYNNIHLGIQGGVNFPVHTFKNGALKGQLSLAQDLTPAYKHEEHYGRHRFTALRLGAIYVPTGNHIVPVSAGQAEQKRKGKRVPKDGFQFGLTQHDIILISGNMAYLSKWRFGLEASTRYSWELGETNFTTTYFGAMYQLGNPRFFIKAGMETLFSKSSEYDEISKDRLAYAGIKYLLPMSNCIGLQVDWGIYLTGEYEIPILPGLGLGFALGRYERSMD